jgi:carboxyl-terminal processing protease
MFKTTTGKIIGALLGVLVLAVIVSASFAGGVIFDQQVLQANSQKISVPAGATQNFQLFVDAWNTVQKQYVDKSVLDPTTLMYDAIGGMVDGLGDTGHSRFMTPDMVKQQNSFTQGSFEGIGAEVQLNKDNNVQIVVPYAGSPAEKAGVQPGDVILKVDEVDVTGQPLDSVVSRILGPAGTQVMLTLQNPTTQAIRTVTITRAKISIANVTWSMIPGTTIADVHLAGFSSGVTNQLKNALLAIQAQGATGLIPDLRNNPGGLLNEAIGVASQFLKDGAVLQEKDASGKIRNDPVQPGGVATDIPMVVLINQGTASAAEIVSGALQDAGRATLIGDKTFGTGTVLSTFNMPDGSALLLATTEWLTPKGRTIWHKGIVPDQTVTLAANVTGLFADIKPFTVDQVQNTQDTQFLQAIKALGVALK